MRYGISLLLLVVSLLAGCAGSLPPMKTVENVEMQRFMGDWYVIAAIPTFLENEAHNAVESYVLNPDGSVAITYQFNDGGYDGEEKVYSATGYINEAYPGNAVWGVEFVWPFRADYRVIYLDDGYRHTIIGRKARDYVWIMARDAHLSPGRYRQLKEYVAASGYDLGELRRIPQSWPSQTGPQGQ